MLSGHLAFSVLGMQSIFSIRKFEGASRLSSECARKCSWPTSRGSSQAVERPDGTLEVAYPNEHRLDGHRRRRLC